MLTRYWFEFEEAHKVFMYGLHLGCGVTAFSYSDALSILSRKIFINAELPNIQNYIEDIDIRTLDSGHVIPNMWIPSNRGIWYPLGYHDNI